MLFGQRLTDSDLLDWTGEGLTDSDLLKWREQGLTDSDLSVKLYDLSQDKTFKRVDFSGNSLQTIPDFKQHKQFECVEVFDLYDNKIKNLDVQRLPCDVKVLRMYGNHVSELVDLTGCHRLKVLWLGVNRIQTFNPRHLPENIQELHMASNQLTEWPDVSHCHKLRVLGLSDNQITDLDPHTLPLDIVYLDMSGNKLTEIKDFSHHKKLQTLHLIGNEIMSIYDTNRDVSFWYIDRFHQTFFDNEHGYNQLRASPLPTGGLKQPPYSVFTRGLQSVQTYFKDITLSKRVRHSRKR